MTVNAANFGSRRATVKTRLRYDYLSQHVRYAPVVRLLAAPEVEQYPKPLLFQAEKRIYKLDPRRKLIHLIRSLT